MVQINTYATDSLNAIFKNTYADKIETLMPDISLLAKDVKFVEAEKQQGGTYIQPVKLAFSHGATYAGPSTIPNLNAPITSTIRQAQVEGYQFYMREQVSYDVAARATSGKNAFISSMGYVVETMMESTMQRLEAEHLYGQNNWGTVGTVTGNVLTISTAEWGPGLWNGAEGMILDDYTAAGVFVKNVTVVSVDMDARTITVDNAAGITATDVLYPKGEKGNGMAGVHTILSNTGTLFGLSATQYSLWRASSFSAGNAALTFNKLLGAASNPVVKGMAKKVKCYVNPKAFRDLVNEFESARTDFSSDVRRHQVERGTESEGLMFYYQTGVMQIISHPMVKEGYAYGLSIADWRKVGATDVTFKLPGQGDQFFSHMENTPAYELRCMSDYALFTPRPAANFIITNIVNS